MERSAIIVKYNKQLLFTDVSNIQDNKKWHLIYLPSLWWEYILNISIISWKNWFKAKIWHLHTFTSLCKAFELLWVRYKNSWQSKFVPYFWWRVVFFNQHFHWRHHLFLFVKLIIKPVWHRSYSIRINVVFI